MTTPTGRCTEAMAGVLGHPLGCTLTEGHRGQHHDGTTGAHWMAGPPTQAFHRRTAASTWLVRWDCVVPVGAALVWTVGEQTTTNTLLALLICAVWATSDVKR